MRQLERMFQRESVRVDEKDLFNVEANRRSPITTPGTGVSQIGRRKGNAQRICLEDITELATE